ncbi:MAG: LysM peptidoglycan-binding domain-containing protein [Nitrospinota bacterium]
MPIGRLYLPPDGEKPPPREIPEPSSEPAEEAEGEQPEGDTRIEKDSGPQIPIVLNAQVRWFIRYFSGPHRSTFARWLARSTRYNDMMRRILREEGVPEDLIYVALIESGYNPKAYSWAGASGIWQFMRSTARRYGLLVNWWIDERRNPVKSTRAAARYFKELHATFQSWHLAQAGYNAGQGRIQRGLRRLRRKDFWTLAKTRYISRETRNFVPKFVAASIIAKNPEAYGFHALVYEEPLRFEEVPVPRPTDLRRIAAAAGVSMRAIQRLNPDLRRWKTPPNYPDYKIKVPPGTSEKVVEAFRRRKSKRFARRGYRVRRGDTLAKIAYSLGTTVEALAELNDLRDPGRIYEGQKLLTPAGTRDGARAVRSASSKKSARKARAKAKPRFHVVRPGETLWDISDLYGVPLKDILAWNRLPKDAWIRPGDKIRLSSQERPNRTRLKRLSPLREG